MLLIRYSHSLQGHKEIANKKREKIDQATANQKNCCSYIIPQKVELPIFGVTKETYLQAIIDKIL
jgi:hypothetical protein